MRSSIHLYVLRLRCKSLKSGHKYMVSFKIFNLKDSISQNSRELNFLANLTQIEANGAFAGDYFQPWSNTQAVLQ